MRLTILAGFLAFAGADVSAQTLTIARQDCIQLTRHHQAADVEHRPGNEIVNGKPVVAADLSAAPPLKLTEDIPIAITVEIEKRFPIPVVPDQFKPEAYIGAVTVRDGRAYFNGQPLGDDGEAMLAELCRKAR